MKIIKVSQSNDREAWLELRRDKITGTRAKYIKPLSRGVDRTPEGFWQMIADRVAIAKDGEPEEDRGLRLENEAILLTQDKFDLDLDLDPGMWVSDVDEDIAISPDSAEVGDKPTYAVEAKCLDSKNHIKAVLLDKRAQKKEEYYPLDSLQISSKCDFRHQAIQYFVVNENLETLYVAFYDDRIVLDNLVHHTIIIKRSDVAGAVQEQLQMEVDVLKQLRETIRELKSE